MGNISCRIINPVLLFIIQVEAEKGKDEELYLISQKLFQGPIFSRTSRPNGSSRPAKELWK